MARIGTVGLATRLVGIHYELDADGEPKGGLEAVTFEIDQDIGDAEGPAVTHRAFIHPSNVQQLEIATQAWAQLSPLLRGRFTPGGS